MSFRITRKANAQDKPPGQVTEAIYRHETVRAEHHPEFPGQLIAVVKYEETVVAAERRGWRSLGAAPSQAGEEPTDALGGLLGGSVKALEAALARGDGDRLLNQLYEAEEAGANRTSALRAISRRGSHLNDLLAEGAEREARGPTEE